MRKLIVIIIILMVNMTVFLAGCADDSEQGAEKEVIIW